MIWCCIVWKYYLFIRCSGAQWHTHNTLICKIASISLNTHCIECSWYTHYCFFCTSCKFICLNQNTLIKARQKHWSGTHMRFRVMREFNLWIFKIKSLGNRMYKSCVSQFRMVQLLVPISTSSHPRIHFLIPMSINQIFWAFSGVDDFNSSISCSNTIRHQK